MPSSRQASPIPLDTRLLRRADYLFTIGHRGLNAEDAEKCKTSNHEGHEEHKESLCGLRVDFAPKALRKIPKYEMQD